MPGLGEYQSPVFSSTSLRLLHDEGQRDQPQIALRQHPPGAHIFGIHAAAVTAAEPEPAAEAMTAMVSRRPLFFARAAALVA